MNIFSLSILSLDIYFTSEFICTVQYMTGDSLFIQLGDTRFDYSIRRRRLSQKFLLISEAVLRVELNGVYCRGIGLCGGCDGNKKQGLQLRVFGETGVVAVLWGVVNQKGGGVECIVYVDSRNFAFETE